MIDEKKLIKELEDNGYYLDGEKTHHEMIDIVYNQPKAGEWILCSERLPEKAGAYIVTKKQRTGEIQVALGTYQAMFNTWSGNGNFKEVLAWMPLPEPYRKDVE